MSEPAGLEPLVLNIIKEILQKELHTKKTYSVFIFGSRSKNNYRQYSDLDLWLETNPALSIRETTILYEKFENSNLPINIDLVTPESCLPVYLEQIQSEKKLWFDFKK